MRIKHRFVFDSHSKDIINFLKTQKVELLEINKWGNSFMIFEDSENYGQVIDFFKTHKELRRLTAPWSSHCIYTKQERDEAKWLTIRPAWDYGYPQPSESSGYRHTTYDASNYCEICRNNLVQKESFVFKKSPNWGRRNFLALYWIYDEIFVSSRAESVFKSNDVRGVAFRSVLSLSGKEIEGTKQLVVEQYIKPGLKSESIESEFVCPKCGKSKYLTKSWLLCFAEEAFENIDSDVVKTSDKFGAEHACVSKIFISQRLRRIILDNKLDTDRIFDPVQLV